MFGVHGDLSGLFNMYLIGCFNHITQDWTRCVLFKVHTEKHTFKQKEKGNREVKNKRLLHCCFGLVLEWSLS